MSSFIISLQSFKEIVYICRNIQNQEFCICIDSVFELVSTEDKARMEAAKLQATPKQTEPPHSSATATMPPGGDGLQATPSVSAESKGSSELQMASGSSAVFVPFARNPVKQKRYETYLDATKNKRPCKHSDFH